MVKIRVRGHTKPLNASLRGSAYTPREYSLSHIRELVFDFETRTEPHQATTFGSFKVFHNGCQQHQGLVYSASFLDADEIRTLQRFAAKNAIPL